jgi:prepilin-type N-terminal cleavage/methylation domain-containing protein/prepilin-type processing-associated H-X9-DG protein
MKMRTRKFRGFTLIELLVVISIIGMLMALLLPAVQNARETARGNTCRSNMRNMAIAATQFEHRRKIFPGYRNPDPKSPASDGSNARSWTFMLLPYIERNDLYDAFVGTATTASNQITQGLELLACPSDPPDGTSTTASSFVMNTGMLDITPTTALPSPDYAANGIGHDLITGKVTCNAGYVGNGDGLANTILFTENAEGGNWIDVTERGQGCTFVTDAGKVVEPTGGTGGLSLAYKINGLLGSNATSTDAMYARPTAYHPGGVNVAFADGHVRFVNEQIQYYVYIHIMTPRGSAAKYPNDGKLLNYDTFPKILDENALQ